MANVRKVNDNGPPPGSPNENGPQDREYDAAAQAAHGVGVHMPESWKSQEMLDDLELSDKERAASHGCGVNTRKAPWRRGAY